MAAPSLITTTADAAALSERLMRAQVIGLDAEGNGLYAFRSQLCVMQLAWHEDDRLAVAIVDTLALDVAPLARALGANGPPKVLHDLTFDARMLHERGVALGNVRDTSVTARFLGVAATGLAALVDSRLGVKIDKRLQEHDWSLRPLTPAQLGYLAGDVTHLLALEAGLAREAAAADIIAEIEEECRYKLLTALRPPKNDTPAWLRIKGARRLPRREQALLLRLVEQRDAIAERLDKPPFKIAANALLLELARRAPDSERSAAPLLSSRGPGRFTREWLAALQRGRQDEPPHVADDEPPPMQHDEIALRKRLDAALGHWRRSEAEARAVDLQVVLPGHCVGDLCAVLARRARASGDAPLLEAVEGLGRVRIARYASAWEQLAHDAVANGAPLDS
jgi:ribonuclease D